MKLIICQIDRKLIKLSRLNCIMYIVHTVMSKYYYGFEIHQLNTKPDVRKHPSRFERWRLAWGVQNQSPCRLIAKKLEIKSCRLFEAISPRYISCIFIRPHSSFRSTFKMRNKNFCQQAAQELIELQML